MSGPLEGIKVLDLTTVIMGPYATQILGDMGADVIKVEAMGGDVLRYSNSGHSHGMSNIFLNNNRNKRSLALDLKNAKGREALLKLAAECDVLVSNVRPKAMARLGLSYDDVRSANPSIIYVSGVGFGQDGPYAERAAYDDLIQTMIGVPDLFRRAYGNEPHFLPSNFCDRVTGLNMVNAVTAALFHRERTGKGQSIEVPMFETMLQFLMADHLGGYTFEPPEGPPGYERIVNPNRRPFATKDGYIGILVYNDKQWVEFLEIADRSELIGQGIFATMSTRGQNIVDVYGFVQECFRKHTTAEWLERLGKTDLPHASIPTLEDLFDDEHLQATNFFVKQEHPSEGAIRTTAIPSKWSESQPDLRHPVPRLGEDSHDILMALGYSEEKIREMVATGATRVVQES